MFTGKIEVDVKYKEKIIKGQRINLLVENEVIVELKTVKNLPKVATAQVLSYLKVTGIKLAILINFSGATLIEGVKRISL